MKALPRFTYFVCFVGLGAVAAVALNRATEPSMSADLLRAVFLAAICAGPGLIHRRLWPLAIVLLPLGCYLVLRTTIPLTAEVDGFVDQLRYYADQLRQGASTYRTAFFPLPVADYPELQLLLAFTEYWVTAAAAFLALSFRRPVAAVVLLLAVMGYSLTVDTSSRALWPALLFAVLAVCLLVICRGLSREGWRLRDAVAGGAVGVVGSLLAFALLTAAPTVAATAWQDWRTWDPFGQGGTIYTFNWLQSYPWMLDPANDATVMSVESPLPSYWRASALDTFTGSAWVTSQAFLIRTDPTEEVAGQYTFVFPTTELMPAGESVTEVFEVWGVSTNYFFTGGDPRSLEIDQDVALRMNQMRSLRVATTLQPTLEYTLEAVIPELRPSDLVGLGTEYPDEVERYLTLPFSRIADIEGPDKQTVWTTMMSDYGPDGWEWTDLYALNERIIGDAIDPYEITLRIERYLRLNYIYSLDLPTTDYSSQYAAFLFDTGTGYCQHFAGAMALLLRYNGIPARVALGFTSGEEDDGTGAYVVTYNNAHAWVEAYFPTVGWVTFEPTPGRGVPTAGASLTSPGFIYPYTDTNTPYSGTTDVTTPRPTVTEDTQAEGGTTTTGERRLLSRAPWLPWVAGLVVILAAWPVVRGLWRRRRLHRGSPEQRLQASLALLRTDLSDYGVPTTRAHTLEETLHILQGHIGLEPDLGLVARAEAVLFGGRRATPRDVKWAEDLRDEVKTRLRRRHGWARTLFAWYGVPRFSRST
jgi:transglutaminase-like putative cysteine protease